MARLGMAEQRQSIAGHGKGKAWRGVAKARPGVAGLSGARQRQSKGTAPQGKAKAKQLKRASNPQKRNALGSNNAPTYIIGANR